MRLTTAACPRAARVTALLLAISAVTSASAAAAIIYVTTIQQGVDTGLCSLQEAIYSANFDRNIAIAGFNADGTDRFVTTNCVAGSGDDRIILPTRAVLQMNSVVDDAHNIWGPTATPIIFTNITIEGFGAELMWTGSVARAFTVGRASIGLPDGTVVSGIGSLTIRNAYIKGFIAKGGDGAGGGGGGMGAGGAIFVAAAFLTVENCTFDGNRAIGGNGSTYSADSGGGGGGGLGGNGGDGIYAGGGGGGGGSRGNGAAGQGGPTFGQGPGGGGGGTLTNASGQTGGIQCGADGGIIGHNGGKASCVGGGGGGGGGIDTCDPLAEIEAGDGGAGSTGGGGGGGGSCANVTGANGAAGGFGGGGGAAGGEGGVTDTSGGNGGFGGGGGVSPNEAGAGGKFGGAASHQNGGGGAGLGGAIYAQGGAVLADEAVVIRNSTFTGNDAIGGRQGGDGSDTHAGTGEGHGGALFASSPGGTGSTALFNVTIDGNLSTGSGAGIYIYQDPDPCHGASACIFDNRTDVFLRNTIVANNGGSTDGETRQCVADGNNLLGGLTANLIENNDPENPCQQAAADSGVLPWSDPQLGPLGDNGGLTPTMAIVPITSNDVVDYGGAYGTADPSSSLPNDQRGLKRPSGDGHGYDVGAFELCVPAHNVEIFCTVPEFEDGTTTQTLNVQTTSSAGGTITPAPGTYAVAQDGVIILSAAPNPGYCFTGWSGNVVSPASATTAVILNQSQSVTANFAQCDFSISPIGVLTASLGGSGSETVTVNSLGIFAQPVALSVSGQPSGVKASIATPVSLTAGGSAGSVLSVTVGPSVIPQTFVLTVTGTTGALSHAAQATVTVAATPAGIANVIKQELALGCIDNAGIAQSLIAKVGANQDAFPQEVRAQIGHHIALTCVDPVGGNQFDPAQALLADFQAVVHRQR